MPGTIHINELFKKLAMDYIAEHDEPAMRRLKHTANVTGPWTERSLSKIGFFIKDAQAASAIVVFTVRDPGMVSEVEVTVDIFQLLAFIYSKI